MIYIHSTEWFFFNIFLPVLPFLIIGILAEDDDVFMYYFNKFVTFIDKIIDNFL